MFLVLLYVDLGSRVRPKRLKQESEKGGGQEGRRSEDSPSKPRSLNDPETVRMNAKKALHQTLWKRSVTHCMGTNPNPPDCVVYGD